MKRTERLAGALAAAAMLAVLLPAAHAQGETATAVYEPVPREHVIDGVVEAVNRSTVSAQVSARVTAIHFDVDDQVEAGTLLLEFDDTELRARLREAVAMREAASARLEAARAHFRRIENLRQRNTASQAEFDAARSELDAALASLDAAEAVIAQIERQIDYTQVRAPYSGIVTARHIELGESANPGTPLMSGFSLEKLRVVAHVPQRLASGGGALDDVHVHVPGREAPVESGAVTVFPYAAERTGTVAVRIALPTGTTGIYPGMLVKAAFNLGTRLRLSVPAQALVQRSEVTGVYVVGDDGGIELRYVRAGARDDEGSVEILAGLDEGERVALDPAGAMAARDAATR